MEEVRKTLNYIQTNLDAPKGRFNSFGKYKYRSCEDILEAVKPLLEKTDSTLTIQDDIINIGNRFYVKATATICIGDISYSVSAYAREPENKKGMDESQITGASSSYARKYALNGLFCIDDNQDAESTNNGNGNSREYISEEQVHFIRDNLITAGLEKAEGEFLSYLGVEKLELLPKSDYQKAITAIEAKTKKVKK